MKFILGKKLNMTEVYDETGKNMPATVIHAGPIIVTQVKSVASDGYVALQVGFEAQKDSRVNKAQRGSKEAGKEKSSFKTMKEFRMDTTEGFKVGDSISLDTFKTGDFVTVSALSKGKGFQGVVKRHGFKGGSRTHGQKHSEREPGAIGGGARAGGRVAKGIRMAGRMGGERMTFKNMRVLATRPEEGLLVLAGSVPGRRGTLVEIVA